jgi:hypothetical protein
MCGAFVIMQFENTLGSGLGHFSRQRPARSESCQCACSACDEAMLRHAISLTARI